MPNETYFKIIKRSLIGLVVLILLLGSFGTVKSGEVGVRTFMGKATGTVEPGLYVKIPFLQKVHKVSTQTQALAYEGESALTGASKDLQNVNISTVVNYKINPNKVMDLFVQYKSLENHESTVLRPIVRDNAKAISASYTAEELVTKRNEYGDNVRTKLNDKLADSFVIVEQSNITDIQFSPEFSKAIERKVTAVQDAEASKNKLVQVQYEGDQIITTANAEAKALEIKSKAVNSQGGAEYLKLQELKYWNGSKCTSYCYGIGTDIPAQILGERDN